MADRGIGGGAVTIFDVAREAGVSTATVSRVANDHGNIRPETRQRVEDAMAKLGYVANLRARGLAGGKTNVIGLLVDALESSYVTQIAKGIDRAVSVRGYNVMLSTMHLRQSGSLHLEQLFNGLADGLIVLLAPGFEPHLDRVAERGFPVVLIDHTPTSDEPVVKTANDAGTRLAMEHLVDIGHRRIGFIAGYTDVSSGKERLDGYKASLTKFGLSFDEQLIQPGDYLIESGVTGTSALLDLDDPPTAILCCADMTAFGAIQVARERGLRLPEDLSIVGFDDIPEAAFVMPPLTTVRQPLLDMGRLSAELLMDAIEGSTIPKAVELPTELVIRESTAPPRA